MKKIKITYVFAAIAIVTGIASMVISIITNKDWMWQMCAAVWAGVALLNELRLDKLTEQAKDLIDHYTTQIDKSNKYD